MILGPGVCGRDGSNSSACHNFELQIPDPEWQIHGPVWQNPGPESQILGLECQNPGPRYVWTVASQLQFTTSFPLNPADSVDPVDPVPCRKVVLRLRETPTFAK